MRWLALGILVGLALLVFSVLCSKDADLGQHFNASDKDLKDYELNLLKKYVNRP